jgi:hypothetical protein
MAALIGLLLWSLSPSQEMLVGLIQTTLSIVSQARLAADLPLVLHAPLRDKRPIGSVEESIVVAMPGVTNSRSSE